MPENNCQKIKLLMLMELLRSETDEKHPMKTNEICSRLGEMNISCERRTLGKDIALLREYGFEIMSELKNHQNAYWIADRSFSAPELRILIDAVQAANFIPDDMTHELTDKIAALAGSHAAEVLKENAVCFNGNKHNNRYVLYNIDAVNDAIREHRKVSFLYFDLDENGKRVYRREGRRYVAEPQALIISSDNYYLLAYSPEHGENTHYRVDRMERVAVENESCEHSIPSEEKLAEQRSRVFRMFGGETENVELRFTKAHLGAVYDKFGERTKVVMLPDGRCVVNVDVQISPTFFAWLFQMAPDMELVSPAKAVEAYRAQINAAASVCGRV